MCVSESHLKRRQAGDELCVDEPGTMRSNPVQATKRARGHASMPILPTFERDAGFSIYWARSASFEGACKTVLNEAGDRFQNLPPRQHPSNRGRGSSRLRTKHLLRSLILLFLRCATGHLLGIEVTSSIAETATAGDTWRLFAQSLITWAKQLGFLPSEVLSKSFTLRVLLPWRGAPPLLCYSVWAAYMHAGFGNIS